MAVSWHICFTSQDSGLRLVSALQFSCFDVVSGRNMLETQLGPLCMVSGSLQNKCFANVRPDVGPDFDVNFARERLNPL